MQLKPKYNNNTQYLNILPKILSQYNNTKHSSIKMTPVEASKKKSVVEKKVPCISICMEIWSNRPFYSYGWKRVDLVLIQTFLLYYVNQVILMLTSIFQGQFP